jgi:hypothetical protein
MAGLVPATHVFLEASKVWMLATSAGKTHRVILDDRDMLQPYSAREIG